MDFAYPNAMLPNRPIYSLQRRMAAAKRSIQSDDMLSLKLMVTYIYVCKCSKRVRSAVYRSIDLDSSGVRRLGIQQTFQHNLPAKWHSPINSRPQACDIIDPAGFEDLKVAFSKYCKYY